MNNARPISIRRYSLSVNRKRRFFSNSDTLINVKSFLLFTVCILLFLPSFVLATDSLKVLFIGNSYTYYNQMPKLFKNLSESAGKKVTYLQSTIPSYWLEGHASDTTTMNKIAQDEWDFVILQEQSQIPTIDYYRYNSMYPAARILNSMITAIGARTVFFMTWGRKYGGKQTIGEFSSPDFTDFFHMQDTLRSAYEEIAEELSAIVAPVGLAWGRTFTLDPAVDLWQIDIPQHPTLKGSYLAACVFFTVLFDESPVGLSFTGGLNANDAAFFQDVAYQTITSLKSRNSNPSLSFRLCQNYPNPFNPSTMINYQLPITNSVELSIYNILGQKVETLLSEKQNAGHHQMEWDASAFASGIYYYYIKTGEFQAVKKMIHIK